MAFKSGAIFNIFAGHGAKFQRACPDLRQGQAHITAINKVENGQTRDIHSNANRRANPLGGFGGKEPATDLFHII